MCSTVMLTLTLFISTFLVTIAADDAKLVQLNVLFRHGDRMPETFPKRFPNDPNMKSSFHPMGSGGLTNEGKLRMYHLGEVLRDKYSEFLGKEYDPTNLFALSSDTIRTKMSLLLVLASLYPPELSNSTRWHKALSWQPIPYQYNEYQHDLIFSRDKCTIFTEEYDRNTNTSEVKAEMEKLKPFLEELRVLTGKESPITLLDCLLLSMNLDIENSIGLPMEPWMVKVLRDPRLTEARKLFHKLDNGTPKLRRIFGGYLLRRINEDMQRASNQTLGYVNKTLLYSGHDKNIISMLSLLGLYDSHYPEFGSAVIFELLSKNDNYYVKSSYYMGVSKETKDLTIPGCATLCPLEQYLNLTKSTLPSNEELPCTLKSTSYFDD